MYVSGEHIRYSHDKEIHKIKKIIDELGNGRKIKLRKSLWENLDPEEEQAKNAKDKSGGYS